MNFENALKKVLEWEGGYTHDPDDAGGETNYGITKFGAVKWGYLGDMKKIPMDLVEKIYKKDYWDKIECDFLPEQIKLFAFDTSVNLGVGKWKKYLSEGLGAENNWNLEQLCERRKKSYTEIAALRNNVKFFKGWMNRLNDICESSKKEIISESKPSENILVEKISPVIRLAEIEISKNIREDNGNNKDLKREIEKYWKNSQYPNGFNEGAPYCCAFVTWVFNEAGISIPRYVACSDIVKWAKNGGDRLVNAKFLTKEMTPISGDLVLFDTRKEGLFNHIGIVESVEGDTITTIEGNTTSKGENIDSNPVGGVYKKIISRFGNISGYIRIYDSLQKNILDSNPEDVFISVLEQEKSKDKLSGMQLLCNLLLGESLKIDGIFGPNTEDVLRKLFRKII